MTLQKGKNYLFCTHFFYKADRVRVPNTNGLPVPIDKTFLVTQRPLDKTSSRQNVL